MKKILSIILSLTVVFSAVMPGFVVADAYTERANDAYGVVFTASDFQSDDCYEKFTNMMNQAKSDGITEVPDAFLFGGDYTSGSEDPAIQVPKVTTTVQSVYPDYDANNLIYVQGNHDSANSIMTSTGFYEFDNFVVYAIGEDSFQTGQSGRSGYDNTVKALAADVATELQTLVNTGDTRPVFVATHVPLHHSSRSSYGENLYAKYLFDVLNEYGNELDIIFLFGHNHSSGYDDYIGGAVNYIAKGEDIRIPIPSTSSQGANGYTEETLTFTYMNYGYVGYSNNSTSAPSTNTLTMGAFELCPTTIEISRYSTSGLYTTETITRVNPLSTDPYVRINGDGEGTQGDSEVLYGTVANIDGETYSWSTTDASVVRVLPAGKNAQVIYMGEGTADATLTVTAADGSVYTDTITIEVAPCFTTETITTPGATYEIYELVDTITAGGNYIIASGNNAGGTTAISTSTGTRVLNGSNVTVNAADEMSDEFHIKNPANSIVWTASKSGNYFLFKNGDNYITSTGNKNGKNLGLILNNKNDNAAQWSYSGNKLTNRNLSSYKIALSGTNYTIDATGSNLYFYQHTGTHTEPGSSETITNKNPYNPVVNLKKGSADVDGTTLKFYEATYGDTVMLDGSFSGFIDEIDNVTVNWHSSDSSVATVENGLVTFVSSGTAKITYVVTDGTTTITKSVDIYISRAAKPVEIFTLTDTFEAGKSYIIANVNTAGSAYAMGNPGFSSGHESYDMRMTACGVTIEDREEGTSIVNTDDNLVWNAVADASGKIYLVNENTGRYLYAIRNSSGKLDLGVTTDKNAAGTVWHQNASGKILSETGYGIEYSSENNFRSCAEGDLEEQFLYEKISSDPFVTLKSNNVSVAGVTKTVYSVTSTTKQTLKGSYANFGEEVTVQWISSDESIATVDEKGVVTFTGVEGIVDITYLVTDKDGNTASATVTYDAKITNEPVRVFKPATTIEPDKSYVVVSSAEVGAASVMSGKHYSDSRLTAEYIVVQPDSSDNSVYVEIPTANADRIWIAESSNTSGYYYLKNEADGYYLWAQSAAGDSDGTLSTSATGNTDPYKWTYSGGTDIHNRNQQNSVYTGIRLSGDGNFRNSKAGGSEESNVYLFEETELKPFVHIRSKYVNVENTTLTRTDICPFQTESLFPKAEHFINPSFVEFTWTSSNPDVATVDNNGVVTYTGNPGSTDITVTATSLIPDEEGNYATATASTKINVLSNDISDSSDIFVITNSFVPGEQYVFAPSNTAGSSVIMSNKESLTSSENRLTGVSCTISQSSYGMMIENSDPNNVWECIESGTPNYYYFRNAETGEYLAFVVDDSVSPYRQVTTTPTLNEFDPDAYLIGRNIEAANNMYSKQSIEYSDTNHLATNDAQEFRMSGNTSQMYIYQRVSKDNLTTDIQIRVSTFLGTDNITNVLQRRYNVVDGDTEQLLRYINGFATIDSIDWAVTNESIATIDENGLLTYTGRDGYVSIVLTVTGTDAAGEAVTKQVRTTFYVSGGDYEAPTEDYPQYPHEGAVRINKTSSNNAGGYNFQTSGVTEVELAVTGVPIPQAVDVVVVFDHSSSMNENDRLQNAIENTRDFALQVVNSNPDNRIAIVTFDRYRDVYDTITSTSPNHSTYESSTEDRIITGDGTPEGAFMTLDDSDELVAQIDALAYNNTSGTNYDFGLQKCYDILSAAKNDPAANKEQYVVFMSDGEPYVFNRLRVEYTSGSDTSNAHYEAWLRGDAQDKALAEYLNNSNYPAVQYFNPRGENWFAEIIKTPEGETIADMPEVDYYKNYSVGLGATIFTIGYDAGEPGSLTSDILTTMASTPENFYYAEGNLQEAYDSILETIIFAANNAVVKDKMGENFNLQFSSSFSLANEMATITLDPAPHIEIGTWSLNSDGTRNEYAAIETITFETNANGDLTAAYSSLKSGNIYDVASSRIIGQHVTYDVLNEEFEWDIGDITRDEIVLKYYAYLEGSAEGEREAGIYETNEYAVLDYTNYRGTTCQQTFPVPSMGWHQAAVNYEFYIVNEKGEPVNSNGIVVPFAERVLIGQQQTKEILLNSTGEYTAYTLVAQQELPDGYVLFNPDTSYQIAVSSGDNPSSAKINDDVTINTTYFRDGTITYSGHGEVPGVTDYTNTHISFAVLYIKGVIADTVVIDYGLPVKISVLVNDYTLTDGQITAIGTTLKEDTGLNNIPYKESRLTDGVTTDLVLENGTASVEGDKIVFTPTNLTMSTENVFYYECLDSDGSYYYTTVTVIPATNIYYEESFFTFKDGNGYTWETAGETLSDKFQAEDRPGTFSFADYDANNVYGSDDAYSDSFTYSLGSAMYTTVDSQSVGKEPSAEFTFCGTGFDLFSVTNNDTGAIIVSVYTPDGKLYRNFIVQTYYGYSYENGEFVPNPDSGECLFQVPVISARDLGYNTYKVVVKPVYSWLFDLDYDAASSENSYDIYVDSVRIYDPAGASVSEDSVIGSAYLDDGEYSPHYQEIRRNILDAETFYSDIYTLDEDQYENGAVFIDGIASLDENGISDKYLEFGPNNELYLAKGQAVAFHVVSDTPLTLSSLQLGMKVVSGGTASVIMMNTNDLAQRAIEVEGATEIYRRLNAIIIWDQTELENNGIYKTKYPIVIMNNSDDDTIVSLTQFKWGYSRAPETAEQGFSLAVTASTPMMAFRAVRNVISDSDADKNPESFPYSGEDIKIQWNDTVFTEGKEATLTVTTPADVVKVTVDGVDITQCEIDENGNKKWTYSFTVIQIGENSYDIQLYDNNGNMSEPIVTERIIVEEAVNDNTKPSLSFFEKILNWIQKVITFFRRLFE